MKKYTLTIIFIVFISILTVSDIIKPDLKYSEIENRKLNTSSNVSLDKDFNTTYEDYVNDQFIFRNGWIDIKSRCEYALGKVENNSIIYGKDNYLFEKISNVDQVKFENNYQSLKKFMNKFADKAYLMIVPGSYQIYQELVPAYAPLVNQKEYIDRIYEIAGYDRTVDLLALYNEKKGEYIYYRTDHHWTTLGAYYAYGELMEAMDLEAASLDNFGDSVQVNDFLGTFYSKAKNYNVVSDILYYYEKPDVILEIDSIRYASLYDYSYLNTRDKYSFFLRGNNGLSIIKNENNEDDRKTLIIKDSFGNSLSPFLTASFNEIHVMDLRAFNGSVEEYINSNEFDNIIVLHSFSNFIKDTSILKLQF